MNEAGEPGFRDILRYPQIRAAVLGTFVIMLGFGILSPVLPNYAASFGVGYDAVGLLISSFSFARLVSDPFVGRFIDRYGERSMVTLGAIMVGASSIAAGLAPTFTLLLVFRAAGGFGSAMFFAALLSYLLRTIPPERTGRVMSVYSMLFQGMWRVGIAGQGLLVAATSAPFAVGLGAVLALAYGLFAALRWPRIRQLA